MGNVMIIVALGGTAAVIVKTIVDGAVRYAAARKSKDPVDRNELQERLERIEIAVDAIAIEVERLGEHHRFNAQLAMNKPPTVPAKVVTPH